ncbi:MAG: hypothetical protein A2044_07555 [Candidatus Firestonebacteria bacterium GWA2_43_8]|nr:MAG: hypothetical protein A2044_07555 [Candidatus Firestonebacteria bacterium GWA2_43_8]
MINQMDTLKTRLPLSDNHCHTEFGYCAQDVTIKAAIERSNLSGLRAVSFTEHSGQLYVSKEDYWAFKFFSNPGLLRIMRDKKLDRIKAYKDKLSIVRSASVRIGFEVEADCNAGITLLPEDKEGIDLLVGAVHFLPSEFINAGSRKLENKFMWANEVLLKNGVDILAHPFRFFIRSKLSTPVKLYKPLAKMLKEYNAAPELNFHTNAPDPVFFENCLEQGLKISLGSDSHNLSEVGDFSKHLKFLEDLGINQSDILKHLFYI